MVERLENVARVVVVDLDGTLLRANSFRIYVRVGLMQLKGVRRVSLLAVSAMRKLGLISHNRYRGMCARLIGFGKDVLCNLSSEVLKFQSPVVTSFIAEKRTKGYRIILATAAMDAYVPAVWSGEFVATEMCAGKVVRDCRGEEKLRSVLALLGGCTPEYVLSDSPSDMPLLSYAAAHGGHAVVVNPTDSTLRFFRKLEPAEFFNVEFLLDSGKTS